MTSIKQAWATGERVSTQDWDSAMQTMDHVQEEKMAKLESMLRLDEAGNAQTFQTAFQKMQNDFTLFRDEQGYSHEDATRMATEAFQQKLMEAGFDQETAMQASRLAHDVSEGQKDRASAEMMSAAQLAQADDHFMQEIQQRYQFNDQDMEIRKQELGAQMKLMGLQGQQLEAALQNDKVQNAMNIVALGMEMGDGSPESMAPFVEQFGSALETYFKAQGIDIAGSDFVKSLTPKPATTSGSIQRTETGAITPGQTVAGIDLATATRPQMQALLGDPANLDKLIKAGAIRQVSSIGELSNMEEATQAFARLGLSGNIAETSKSGATQGMTFKPQTYIYYNGKPYELSGFVTGPFGVGVLKGIDLTTGKETTIKTH